MVGLLHGLSSQQSDIVLYDDNYEWVMRRISKTTNHAQHPFRQPVLIGRSCRIHRGPCHLLYIGRIDLSVHRLLYHKHLALGAVEETILHRFPEQNLQLGRAEGDPISHTLTMSELVIVT